MQAVRWNLVNVVSAELIGLLAACRVHPADDLPRLVLADWLDENNQADRAEFIRVQMELSHPTADVARTRYLKEIEERLFTANTQAWVGQLNRVNPRYEAGLNWQYPYQFRRGLLRFSDEYWIDTTEMLNSQELQAWFHTDEFHWLEQLNLSTSSIDGFVKADIPDELTGRIGLNLHVGQSTRNVNWQQQFRLLAVSSNFTTVRSLEFNGALGEIVLEEITKADVTRIVSLKLGSGDALRAANLIASAPFTALSTLKILGLTEPAFRVLLRSSALGNLTELDLSGCPIGDSGMIALCNSKLAQTLRAIKFPNTALGDVGVAALVQSPLFANMHGPRLNLMMNQIGCAGLGALAESEHVLRFRELVFRENQIGDDGVEALAASPYTANLQYLDFWRNNLTDRGAIALARSPYLKNIVDISLKENQVTEVGTAILHERFGEAAKV
jgi:uncharacterized protein (TIGR02996 family)